MIHDTMLSERDKDRAKDRIITHNAYEWSKTMSIYRKSLDAFVEQFGDILDYDGFTPVLKEGAGVPQYWEDTLPELADSLVPVYTSELVREWSEEGYPEIQDSGLITGTSVIEAIGAVLYEQYSEQLFQLADEAGFHA